MLFLVYSVYPPLVLAVHHWTSYNYFHISKVYWCRSSSPSPVWFNIDTDHAVNTPLNTRRSHWNASLSSAKDFTCSHLGR